MSQIIDLIVSEIIYLPSLFIYLVADLVLLTVLIDCVERLAPAAL